MAEYIDRDTVIDVLDSIFGGPEYEIVEKVMAFAKGRIEKIPAVDVAPVVHGKWVWNKDGMDFGIGSWVCSICGSRPETTWNTIEDIKPNQWSSSHWCGNCGAKMDLEG